MAKPRSGGRRKPGGRRQKAAAVASVADFISGNLKKAKPPRGLRPPKPSGVTGNEAVDSLAEFAAKPWLYATEALVGLPANTFLDQELIKFYVDKLNPNSTPAADISGSGRARIKVKDLGSLVSSPGKWIDEAYGGGKNARDAEFWQTFFGSAMDFAGAAVAARRMGLDAGETINFASAATLTNVSPDMRIAVRDMAVENAALEVFKNDTKKAQTVATRVQEIMDSTASARTDIQSSGRGGFFFADLSNFDTFCDHMNKIGTKAQKEAIAELKKGTPIQDPKVQAVLAGLQNDYNNFASMSRKFGERKQSLINELTKDGLSASEISGLMEKYDSFIAKQGGLPADTIEYRKAFRDLLSTRILTEAQKDQGRDEALMGKWAKELAALDTWDKFKAPKDGHDFQKQLTRIDQALNTMSFAPAVKAELQKYRDEFAQSASKVSRIQGLNASGYGVLVGGQLPVETRIRKALEAQYRLDVKILEQEIIDLQNKLNSGQGLTQKELRELQGQLAKARSDFLITNSSLQRMGFIPGERWRHNLAHWSLAARSFQQEILQGGIVGSLITGSGFITSYYSPATPTGSVQFYKRDGKGGYVETLGPKGAGSLLVPKSEISSHYRTLTSAYYFTFGSMFKTLFYNGEGFLYFAKLKQDNLIKSVGEIINADTKNLGHLLNDKGELKDNILQTLDELQKSTDPNIRALAKGFLKDYDRISKGLGLKWATFLQNKVVQPLGSIFERFGSYRERALMWLASKMKTEAMREAFALFAKNAIGINQVVSRAAKLVIIGVLNALGVATTGGVMNIFIDAVAAVVVWASEKVIKPLLQFASLSIWAVAIPLVVCVCYLLGLFDTATRPFLPQYHFAPGSGSGVSGDPGDGTDAGGRPSTGSICPFNGYAACAQGPNGHFSHAKMGTLAIDVTPSDGVWKAPMDGVVVEASPDKTCEWDTAYSRGGQVKFRTNDGTVYVMLHATPYVTSGQRVGKGAPVAVMMRSLPRSKCWDGAHFHLEVQPKGGGYSNSFNWYKNLKCNISNCR